MPEVPVLLTAADSAVGVAAGSPPAGRVCAVAVVLRWRSSGRASSSLMHVGRFPPWRAVVFNGSSRPLTRLLARAFSRTPSSTSLLLARWSLACGCEHVGGSALVTHLAKAGLVELAERLDSRCPRGRCGQRRCSGQRPCSPAAGQHHSAAHLAAPRRTGPTDVRWSGLPLCSWSRDAWRKCGLELQSDSDSLQNACVDRTCSTLGLTRSVRDTDSARPNSVVWCTLAPLVLYIRMSGQLGLVCLSFSTLLIRVCVCCFAGAGDGSCGV